MYTYSIEYIYPVDSISSGELLYIHQIDSTKIELFIQNTITGQYQQGTSSLFSPASLQLLPGEKGFSFIDQGRLRIKYFNKRSPKTIDFYEPLYNLTVIHWINDFSCYFSAKQGDYIGIFQCDIDETITCLVKKQKTNCLYPQKVEKSLFYVERVMHDEMCYKIIKTSYGYNDNDNTVIYDFGTIPVIFLTMISENEGFILSYQKNIDNSNAVTRFTYYSLTTKQQEAWQLQELFSFSIPLFFLQPHNEDSLYESILPLLPRICGKSIYFVDCANNVNNILWPYEYVISTKEIISLVSNERSHNFTPYPFRNEIIIGGEKITKINRKI